MPWHTKKDQLPTTPLSGVPEDAKEQFEILEMRSLTSDYFERFAGTVRCLDPGEDGSWTIGLLHGSASPLTSVTTSSVVFTPVILLVTEERLVVFDEASTEILLSSAWDRMCRIDLKPVEAGDYQIFALSFLVAPTTAPEVFPDRSLAPLDRSEIGIRYFYTHANPSTFEEIDRYWSQVHVPQAMHQLPSLLI
jgi:hypothetical protein